jgi:hypothetical protein
MITGLSAPEELEIWLQERHVGRTLQDVQGHR